MVACKLRKEVEAIIVYFAGGLFYQRQLVNNKSSHVCDTWI